MLELRQKTLVAVREKTDVWNARHDHRESVDTEAKRESRVPFWVEGSVAAFRVDGLKHRRIHHAATGDFQPAATAERSGLDVDFEAGLGEREKVRAESEFGVFAEQFTEKVFERSSQIPKRDVLVDKKSLHLVELGEVRRINFVAPICGARRNDANRRRAMLHGADLDG